MRGSLVGERRSFFDTMRDESASGHSCASPHTASPSLQHMDIPEQLPDPEMEPLISYVVYVTTASSKWAGTDMEVYMQIVGDMFTTDYIHLREDDTGKVQSSLRYTTPDNFSDNTSRLYFAKGSLRLFRFKSVPVGNIVKICIRHDPTGNSSAAWKMERVVIHRDDSLQRSWSFLCSRWLTNETGNCVELKPSGEVSAGRRACRRASRRLSMGKPSRPFDTGDSTTGAEHFESIRDIFGNDSMDGTKDVSARTEAGTRRVCFQLQKFTGSGCHVYLLGEIPSLGAWQPQHALRMVMQSAADGTWGGEWRLEVEIDDDCDEIKYTYVILNEIDSKSNRRAEHPDRLRCFKLSAPDSLGRTTEGGRIHIRDSFGSNKFGLPSSSSPSMVSRQPFLRQESARRPRSESTPVMGVLSTERYASGHLAPRMNGHMPRDLTHSLDDASDVYTVNSENWNGEKNGMQSDRNSEDSQDSRLPPVINTSELDYEVYIDRPNRSVEDMSKSSQHVIQRDEEVALREWKQQLDASDGQLFKSAHRLLRRQSEVLSLKKRNSVSVSTSNVLVPSSSQSAEDTSPISSEEISDGDSQRPGNVESEVIDLTRSDSRKALLEENNKLLANFNRLKLEKDKQQAMTAAATTELRGNLNEVHAEMSEHCEQFFTQQAELVRLVMDVQESHRSVRDQLMTERDDLHTRWAKEFKARRKLFNTIQELRGNIRVFCRVRPPKTSSASDGSSIPMAVAFPDVTEDESARIRIGSKNFEFDHVFQPSASQKAVYDETSGVVGSVLDGYNVCVFAYGQTGSGKTHTMNGPEDDRGVNFRALVDLFDIVSQRLEFSNIRISVSMMEIYNENLRDLVRPDDGGAAPKLDIRKDQSSSSSSAVYVSNLTEVEVDSVDSVWSVMERGAANRKKGKTNMNEHSSRSHLILRIKVTCEDYASGVKTAGNLHLVDLAGSERVGRSNVSGERLKEAQYINKSLATLGDVFMALLSQSSHIPYRNSKLTYLLQDSLGGDSKTLMFVNVSADSADTSETVSSLQFAQRVAKVELGTAKKHTEKTAESKAVAALEVKETALKDASAKLLNLHRELKKRSEESDVSARQVKSLEKELMVLKSRYEEQHRRDVAGYQDSAEEVRDLRASCERSQVEIKAAKQKAHEVSLAKDEEISELNALLKAKENKIDELSRLPPTTGERILTPALSRLTRHASTPIVGSRRSERQTVPKLPRAAATFAARSRHVRFESPKNDDSELPEKAPVGLPATAQSASAVVPSTPANGPRRIAEGGVSHAQAMTAKSGRPPPRSNGTPVPSKSISFAFGKRVGPAGSDSAVGQKPSRNMRLPRAQTTISRPAQRVSQVSSRSTQPVAQSAGRSLTAARRAGTMASIQRGAQGREG